MATDDADGVDDEPRAPRSRRESEERRGAGALGDAVSLAVDNFSIEVLDFNRRWPRDGQRRPGDVLREVEERMTANKRRHQAIQRWVGAILLAVISVTITTVLSGVWPSLLARLERLL